MTRIQAEKNFWGVLISPFNSIISAHYKYFPLVFLRFLTQ